MKNEIMLLLILISFTYCKEPRILNDNQEIQTYSLINDFILDSLYKVNIISREVMMFEDSANPISPPETYCSYSSELFMELMESKIIDSTDLKLFKAQLSSKSRFLLNPNKLHIKTFSRDSLYKVTLNRNSKIDLWEYFRKKYNSNSYLIISLPLFSKDNNTLLVTVHFHCGGDCGVGVVYVFKNINGKWKIVYSIKEWIS